MSRKEKYVPTEKAAAFLADVENGKYKREIVTGLAGRDAGLLHPGRTR
jgi:hypothetical protein